MKALRRRARRFVEFKQHMSRTDKPVLMHGIKLDRATVTHHPGTQQGDVVIMDDIEILIKDAIDCRRFEKRESRLLSG